MRRMTFGVALGLVLLVCSLALAAEIKPQSLDSHISSIALFKNGLAFVTREAALPGAATRLRIDSLPVPVHGTFWAWTPGRPDGVRRLVAGLEPTRSTRPATSLAELALANPDRELELTLGDGKLLKGRVVPRAEGPTPAAAPDPYSGFPVSGREPILITTSTGTVAIDPGSIQRVSVSGTAPRTEVDVRTPKARLDLETTAGPEARLSLFYLSRGATWAPSYSIDLIGKDKARLTAKAEIVDELEDLDGVEAKLVTGYPNIAYANVDDPIAMRGDLAAFLAALGGNSPATYGRLGGAMAQVSMADRMEEARAPSYSTAPPPGERADELFLYPLPKLSLRRGERAYVPLFSVDATAEHLYELSLDDRVHDNRFDAAPQQQAPLEIWHRVRLTNSGTVPWTTAPAMATRGGAIVAQDELPYAAAGGTTTLRITRVSDLHADADEFEIERKPRALEVYGRVYDEITVRGVAEIASQRDEDVTLTVTKSLTGQVLSTLPIAKVDRTTQRLAAVNPSSAIRWSLPLKARSRVKIEYRYKVLILV